ncbi:MAG: hypothetical protein KGI49_01855 [Patescibacteria group bacterium]|nr:hypothetical protein [Patescibacteria group bacterium]
MTTKMLERSVRKLTREVESLRSFVIAIVSNRDDEGEYKPEFVKEILKASREKPEFKYAGKGSLLKLAKSI